MMNDEIVVVIMNDDELCVVQSYSGMSNSSFLITTLLCFVAS